MSGVRGLCHIYGFFNGERRNLKMLCVELVFFLTLFGRGININKICVVKLRFQQETRLSVNRVKP